MVVLWVAMWAGQMVSSRAARSVENWVASKVHMSVVQLVDVMVASMV